MPGAQAAARGGRLAEDPHVGRAEHQGGPGRLPERPDGLPAVAVPPQRLAGPATWAVNAHTLVAELAPAAVTVSPARPGNGTVSALGPSCSHADGRPWPDSNAQARVRLRAATAVMPNRFGPWMVLTIRHDGVLAEAAPASTVVRVTAATPPASSAVARARLRAGPPGPARQPRPAQSDCPA